MMFFMVLFFNLPGVFSFSIPIQTFCFVLGGALFIGTIFVLWEKFTKGSLFVNLLKDNKRLFILGALVFFIVQLLFVSTFYRPSGYDAHDVYMAAQGLPIQRSAGVLSDTYFSTFPNNLFLLFFERFIYQLNLLFGGRFDFYWLLVVINILAVDLAIYLIYAISKRIFSREIAVFSLVLAILFLGFTPWLTVVYSDTLSLPLGLLSFFLYLKCRATENVKLKLAYSFFIGFVLYLGFLIKPSAIFSGIAIFLIEVIMCNYKSLLKNGKKIVVTVCVTVSIVIGAAAVRIPYNHIVEHQQLVPYDEALNMPFTYWLMIGLHEVEANGAVMYGFGAGDFSDTYSIVGKEAKIEYNVQVIKERLKTFGVFGYLSYLWKKSIWILGDGTFYWGNESIHDSITETSGLKYVMQQFIYPSGKYHKFYAYMLQTMWLIILFTFAMGLFCIKKYANKEFYIVLCTVLGSIVFVLLFEGRSRYIMNNLGFYIMLAALGLEKILENLKNVLARGTKYDEKLTQKT